MWSIKETEHRINEFKERIKIEPDFCKELYEYATIRLMAMKYSYYVLSNTFVHDYTYDIEEKNWYIMGRALNILNEEETSPCVGFDETHPKAKEAIELAIKLVRK